MRSMGRIGLHAKCFVQFLILCYVQGEIVFLHTPYYGRVYETATGGEFVLRVNATDLENGRPSASVVNYFLTGQQSTLFSIDRYRGNIHTGGTITKPVGFVYQFHVVVTANGLSKYEKVAVEVSHRNLYPPIFHKAKYDAFVYRNSPADIHVLTVRASDKDEISYNNEFLYSIGGAGKYDHLFEVDEKTGQVLLVSRLKSTTPEVFDLLLFARDTGTPTKESSAIVTVYLSDISVPMDFRVVNVTTRTAYVCWEKPRYGSVIGYGVQYFSVNKSSSAQSSTVLSSKTCLLLEGLNSWTVYYASVFARGTLNRGPESQQMQFMPRDNECLTKVCKVGTCVVLNTFPGYKCLCPNGYYGYNCQLFNPCVLNPCANDGRCTNVSSDAYTCECATGYWGRNCKNFDHCTSQPCLHEGRCTNTSAISYRCSCRAGYYGDNCELFNPCEAAVCRNGGECVRLTAGEYRCDCSHGYFGPICQHFDPCSSSPCQNAATCTNISSEVYQCRCAEGYYGNSCERYNPCAFAPCKNSGSCRNISSQQFICTCATGFYGEYCERKDMCRLSSPCRNGRCVSTGDGVYSCECDTGWYGDDCARYNYCTIRPCRHNSTCRHLGHMTYECICLRGYWSENCERYNPCILQPCLNAGACRNDSSDAYTCACKNGYYGDRCQFYNPCVKSPCRNQAQCVHTEHNSYVCRCLEGYGGQHCESFNPCSSRPCLHAATCVNVSDSRYECLCSVGYYGKTCENYDACNVVKCRNEGQCLKTGDGKDDYHCLCKPGYYGNLCQNFNPCYSLPCTNGGSCINDSEVTYHCKCLHGYFGKSCEKYDPCSQSPCLNQAVCVNTSNTDYICECLPGYYEQNCRSFNACVLNPCLNGARCFNMSDRNYRCDCKAGYYGTNCDKYNPCAQTPCQHFGICHNTSTGGYICDCVNSYYGDRCQHFNPCSRDPCLNEATCASMTNTTYMCRCDLLFFGTNCQNFEFCAQDPCKNQATCRLRNVSPTLERSQLRSVTVKHGKVSRNIQVISDFSCFCKAGYEGKHCETEVNECLSSPCQNRATCHDVIDGYTCECVAGYEGRHCGSDIDECASSPCQYDGTCVDGVNQYTCECAIGYFGNNCAEIGKCLTDETRGVYGRLIWPITRHTTLVNLTCPYGGVGEAKAFRRCSVVGKAVVWQEPDYSNCKQMGVANAEQLLMRLKRQTTSPEKMSSADVSNVTDGLEEVLPYALQSNQLAKEMVSILSDVLAANTSAIRESDATNKSGIRLRELVSTYTSDVKLDERNAVSVTSPHLLLQVRELTAEQTVGQAEVTFRVPNTGAQSSEVAIPSDEVFTFAEPGTKRRVQFALYENSKLFVDGTVSTEDVNSMQVVSASIKDLPKPNLRTPLRYVLPNPQQGQQARCVYWNTRDRSWSSGGVTMNKSQSSETVCLSSHMSSFALIAVPPANTASPLSDKEAKKFVASYVGCALCSACLLVTIATYVIFSSLRAERSGKVLLNFCASALLFNVFFVCASQSENFRLGACVLVSSLWHYFLLVTCLWMMIAALNIHQMLITVFITYESYFLLKRCVIAWGIPVLIVCITMAVDLTVYETARQYCVVTEQNKYVFYVSWMGLSCGILTFTFIIFILIVREFLQSSLEPSSDGRVTTQDIRGGFIIFTLLVVTSQLGLLVLRDERLGFDIAFCLCNVAFGLSVLLFHCALNSKTRDAWSLFCTTCQLDDDGGRSSPSSRESFTSSVARNIDYGRTIDDPVSAVSSGHLPVSQRGRKRKNVSIQYGRPDVRFADLFDPVDSISGTNAESTSNNDVDTRTQM